MNNAGMQFQFGQLQRGRLQLELRERGQHHHGGVSAGSTATLPGPNSGCVAFNPFGPDAASQASQIADDIVAIDAGMRLGFNWKFGPFELIDQLGAGWFADRLKAEGKVVPEFLRKAAGRSFYRVENGRLEYLDFGGEYKQVVRPAGVLLLSDVKRATEPVAKNVSASLWDVGDGVLCFEFHTKMNAIDPDTFALLRKSISIINDSKGKYKGLVIHNEANNFSAGANLGLAMFVLNVAMYPAIERAYLALRESFADAQCLKLPMKPGQRSLNLSNAVAVSVFEAWRQNGFA